MTVERLRRERDQQIGNKGADPQKERLSNGRRYTREQRSRCFEAYSKKKK
jgi:hypothetical protein